MALVTDVQGRRNKGRPKWRWMDSIRDELTEKGQARRHKNGLCWRRVPGLDL